MVRLRVRQREDVMRMWMLPPQVLCRNHLLGEHKELHMLAGSISKGISLQGYYDKGLIEPQHIFSRHREVVEEMERRGYNHESPLDAYFHGYPPGTVDRSKSTFDLMIRCPDCAALMREHSTFRRRWSPSRLAGFRDCEMAWAREVVYRETVPADLEPADVEREIRMRIGSAYHKVIEDWLKDGKFDRLGLTERWSAAAKRHLGGFRHNELAREMIREGYPRLTNLRKALDKLGLLRRPLMVEEQVKIDLGNGWVLTGKLDAAWQHGLPFPGHGGGITEVVDWKSGRGAKGEAALRRDNQMQTYALLAMHRFGLDRVLVSLDYIRRGTRTSVMFERKQLEEFVLARYTRAAAKVDNGAFTPANDSRCWDCAFARAGRPCPGSPPAMEK